MEKAVLLCCLITAATATFFHSSMPVAVNSSTMNVCIYSADPNKYDPKCILCQNVVYPHALEACLNVSTMPNNVSYDQANCIEKNCAINYPKDPQPTSKFEPLVDLLKAKEASSNFAPLVDLLKVKEASSNFAPLVDLLKSKFSKRSADGNNLSAMDYPKGELELSQQSIGNIDNVQSIQRVDTYASDQGYDDDDY